MRGSVRGSVLTESFRQVLEVVLRENEVGELCQSSDLFRQLLQLVLRHVELRQSLQVAHRLTAQPLQLSTVIDTDNFIDHLPRQLL